MAKLTAAQKRFLNAQNIPLSCMFDASGMSRNEYRAEMKQQQEKKFAYGVTPCKSGHTLRNRSGNCIECDTANIEFQLRHEKTLYVYIAGSLQERLIKVGTTSNLDSRIYLLNLNPYAGADDWQLLAYFRAKNAGAYENNLHKHLKFFKEERYSMRSGRLECNKEAFGASYSLVRDFIWLEIGSQNYDCLIELDDVDLYEFN